MSQGVEQASFGTIGDVLEILTVKRRHITFEKALHVRVTEEMNRAEHMVKRCALVKFFQPWFHAGKPVAFDAQTNAQTACIAFGCSSDQGHILVKLMVVHPHFRPPVVRHGTVAGEGDTAESASQGLFGVFFGLSESVFAQGRVHVAIDPALGFSCGKWGAAHSCRLVIHTESRGLFVHFKGTNALAIPRDFDGAPQFFGQSLGIFEPSVSDLWGSAVGGNDGDFTES